MLTFILRRLAVALMVAVTVSLVTFVLLRLSGDPAVALAGEGASAVDIERVRIEYGLDRPLLTHYWDWISRAVTGDLGHSHNLKADVATVVFQRLPVTLKLGGLALLVALVIALPLGIAAGLRPNSLVDRIALALSVFGQAMPTFWFGLMMIIYVGVYWRLLPISGNSTLAHFVMPAIALGYYAAPGLMRLTRTGIVEAMTSDYIRTARAKGLRMPAIVFRHALRNAMIPVVSLAAVQFGFMLGGSIVVEAIFALNGLGHLAWTAIQRSDFDVMQAIVLVVALVYIVLTFCADVLNAFLDPRIRVS